MNEGELVLVNINGKSKLRFYLYEQNGWHYVQNKGKIIKCELDNNGN